MITRVIVIIGNVNILIGFGCHTCDHTCFPDGLRPALLQTDKVPQSELVEV